MQNTVDYYLYHVGIKDIDVDFLQKFLNTQMIYRDPKRMSINPKPTVNEISYCFELKLGWQAPEKIQKKIRQAFDHDAFVVENCGDNFVSSYPHTTHQLTCTIKHQEHNRRYRVLLYYET